MQETGWEADIQIRRAIHTQLRLYFKIVNNLCLSYLKWIIASKFAKEQIIPSLEPLQTIPFFKSHWAFEKIFSVLLHYYVVDWVYQVFLNELYFSFLCA